MPHFPAAVASASPAPRRGIGWNGWVMVLMGGLFFWSAIPEERSWRFGGEQRDYYNLLIDGFLAGQLHMRVDVAPELAAVANPYDPRQRPPGAGLHDATYYRGKYYLYFGVAPVVTLMLPFRLLTGVDLPLPVAVAVFTYGGFLLSAVLLLSWRRRYFPDTSGLVTGFCLVALGAAGMGLVLVRRGNIWELPLSSGYCFAMAALVAIDRSLQAGRSPIRWMAAAGAALGLAVASRLSYLYAIVLLLPPMWYGWREAGRRAGSRVREQMKPAAAALLPLGIIGLALAWYNYARFDDPLEFGVAYQLSGVNEAETRHFRTSYFTFNVAAYLLRPAEWVRYFPFLQAPEIPPYPAGFVGLENLYGVLPHVPVLWLAVLAPLAARRRDAADRAAILTVLAATALLALSTLLTLCFFYAAMARYAADFMPGLVLLGCIGVLAVQRALAEKGAPWRTGVALVLLGVLGVSSFHGLMVGFELYGNFRRDNPRAYGVVARAFNLPIHVWETASRTRHGPREFELQFPADLAGGEYALLTTGHRDRLDRLFVRQEENGWLRIGYEHHGGSRVLSRPIQPEPGRAHRLRVEMGSFFPPEEHPFFAGQSEADVQAATRRLWVELEGEVLLDHYQRFHPATPATVAVGAALPARAGARFPGAIHEVERGSAFSRQRVEGYAVRLRFPARTDAGEQVLLADPQQGWSVHVAYAGARVWFRFSDPAGTSQASAPAESVAGEACLLELLRIEELGGEPSAEGKPSARHRLIVKLNGIPYATWRDDHGIDFGGVRVAGAASTAVPGRAFTGRIFDAARVPRGGDRGSGNFDTLRITLIFPENPPHTREPIVVTGRAGAGDFLCVEYLPDGRFRFSLDHWGRPPFFSAPRRFKPGVETVLEVSMNSFPGVYRSHAPYGSIRVAMDGETVWTQSARLYRADAADVFVAYNPIGGTACVPLFSGSVLNVQRLSGNVPAAERSPQN